MRNKQSLVRTCGTLLLVGAAAAGCVTRGKDFPSETTWIKEGATKKTDVQRILGEPFSVGSSAGRPSWTYGYYDYSLFGKSHQKELKLYWTPEGTVSTYSFNSSFPEDILKGVPSSKVKNSASPNPADFD